MRVGLLFVVLMSAAVLTAQDGPMPAPTRTPPKPKSSTTSSVPPRSDDQPAESSSKDTMIDISPPKGDSVSHPNSGVADDVLEMHPYNPMKAMKDVEVGDYHYKRKNYRAAISRYQEALEYKPHDAVATIALAQSLEKVGDDNGAREAYEDYLKTLPNGPEAARCRKALEHLSKPAKDASK